MLAFFKKKECKDLFFCITLKNRLKIGMEKCLENIASHKDLSKRVATKN